MSLGVLPYLRVANGWQQLGGDIELITNGRYTKVITKDSCDFKHSGNIFPYAVIIMIQTQTTGGST